MYSEYQPQFNLSKYDYVYLKCRVFICVGRVLIPHLKQIPLPEPKLLTGDPGFAFFFD